MPRRRAWTGAWCALAALVAPLWPAGADGAVKRRAALSLSTRRHPGRRQHRLRQHRLRGRGRSAARRRSRPPRWRLVPRRCANAGLVPGPSNLALVEQATLCLVNRDRADRRIAPLAANTALSRAATRYSLEMVSEDFFADVSPAGSTVAGRIAQSGYRATVPHAHPARAMRLAENLAVGCGPLATPESIVSAWMASPPHRANLLRRGFRASGIGVALGVPSNLAGGWTGPSATYTQYLGAAP